MDAPSHEALPSPSLYKNPPKSALFELKLPPVIWPRMHRQRLLLNRRHSPKEVTQQPFVDGRENRTQTTSVSTKYLLSKAFLIDVVFDNGYANQDRQMYRRCPEVQDKHHISSLPSKPPPVKGHESTCICDDENGNPDSLYT